MGVAERVRAASRDTIRSLRFRNFRLFFGGQFVSQIGNWMTLVLQTLLVLRLTDSGVALGLLAAAQFGPVLVLGAWAGLVADRSDKRKLLLIVQSLAMAQSFALAALASLDAPPVGAVFVVAAAGGVTMAFDNPTRRSFVTELVPEHEITNAVGLNSALMTASRVIGPALAGLGVQTVGFAWCFALDGISYVAVLAALWAMRPADLHPAPAAPRGRAQVREGLRYVARVHELWVPLVMMTVVGTFAFNFQVVFPLFVTRDLDGTDSSFTLLFSVLSIGSLAGALSAARRSSMDVRRVALTVVAFGGALAAMAVVPSLAVAFPVGLLVGFASVSFLTASTAIVQLRADPSMRGRVLALQAIVFLGSTPVGGPVVGWVAEEHGARAAIALGAAACLAAGAWGLAMARRAAGTTEGLSAVEPSTPVAGG
ncbi:MAG: MFS transporter [Acidimicrobiales bacterium]|jgi:MFS family permease|nr:MFS transporter [Acidimicrobiales bacterium]